MTLCTSPNGQHDFRMGGATTYRCQTCGEQQPVTITSTDTEARCRELFEELYKPLYKDRKWPKYINGQYEGLVQLQWDGFQSAYFAHHTALKRCVETLDIVSSYIQGESVENALINIKKADFTLGDLLNQTLAELKEIVG